MKYNKITVSSFRCDPNEVTNLGFSENTIIENTYRNRSLVIDKILSSGYNVQILKVESGMLFYIDKRNFRQS